MAAVGIGYINKLIAARAPNEGAALDAEYWAEEVFANVITPRPDKVWRHIDGSHLVTNTHESEVLWRNVSQSTAVYIRNLEWLKDPEIDWMLADMLCFGELEATMRHFGIPRFYTGGRFRWKKALGVASLSLFLWLIWLAILAGAIFAHWTAAAAWVGWTLFAQWRKRSARLKIGELLASMADAYSTLQSSTMSWSNVLDRLKTARDKGASWPAELLRLAEDRAIESLNRR